MTPDPVTAASPRRRSTRLASLNDEAAAPSPGPPPLWREAGPMGALAQRDDDPPKARPGDAGVSVRLVAAPAATGRAPPPPTRTATTEQPPGLLFSACAILAGAAAISVYIGAIFFVAGTATAAAVGVLAGGRAALAGGGWLALLAALSVLPLREPGRLAAAFTRFSMIAAGRYFSLSVVYEDEAALLRNAGRPHVLAYAPHSAMPVGLPVALCEFSPLCHPVWGRVRTLASSTCFSIPIVRHLWFWLGSRPATASGAARLLRAGHTVALTPGGVRECGLLKKGRETVYLKRRTGFIRLALAAGAPIVPVFCFGQTEAYSFALAGPPLMPRKWAARLAKALRFWPMLMWGVAGSPLPHRVKLTVVVGKPIEVPAEFVGGEREASPRRGGGGPRWRGGGGAQPPSSPTKQQPSRDAIAAVHAAYLEAVERMYARHAAACGAGDVPLVVM